MDERTRGTRSCCTVSTPCYICSFHSRNHSKMELCPPCYQFKRIKLKSLAATGICYRESIFPLSNWSNSPNASFWELLALSSSLGGLSLINPIDSASQQYHASHQITSPLVNNIHHQLMVRYTDSDHAQEKAKADVKKRKLYMLQEKITNLITRLPLSLQGSIQQSLWNITTSLYTNWSSKIILHTTTTCICNIYNLCANVQACTFNVAHGLSCPIGGYPTIQHNEVKELTVSLLQQVCYNVAIEPHLQPLTG